MVACALFLRNWGALFDSDLAELEEIAQQRILVAHELPAILGSAGREVSFHPLRAIFELTAILDRWWFRHVEGGIHLDRANLSDEEFDSSMNGRMVIMQFLVELAQGNDSSLVDLYARWQAHHRSKHADAVTGPGLQAPQA